MHPVAFMQEETGASHGDVIHTLPSCCLFSAWGFLSLNQDFSSNAQARVLLLIIKIHSSPVSLSPILNSSDTPEKPGLAREQQ